MDALKMMAKQAQTQRELHWFTNEAFADAHDAAEQDTAEGSWTIAVEADEGDMTKTEMLERIRRLESTEEGLSARVALLEDKLAETNERLELLRAVVMGGSHAQGT